MNSDADVSSYLYRSSVRWKFEMEVWAPRAWEADAFGKRAWLGSSGESSEILVERLRVVCILGLYAKRCEPTQGMIPDTA